MAASAEFRAVGVEARDGMRHATSLVAITGAALATNLLAGLGIGGSLCLLVSRALMGGLAAGLIARCCERWLCTGSPDAALVVMDELHPRSAPLRWTLELGAIVLFVWSLFVPLVVVAMSGSMSAELFRLVHQLPMVLSASCAAVLAWVELKVALEKS